MTEGSRCLKNQWLREVDGYEGSEYNNVENSGLVVGRKLPKLNLEPTSYAIRIEQPPAGLYWIGAYAFNAEKEFGVRVEYLPQARTFREWDLWER